MTVSDAMRKTYVASFGEKRRNLLLAANEVKQNLEDDRLTMMLHQLAGSAQLYGFSKITEVAADTEAIVKQAKTTKEPGVEIDRAVLHLLYVLDESESAFFNFSELREHERYAVTDTIKIFDAATNELIGYLLDVSETGLALIRTRTEAGEAYRKLRFSFQDGTDSQLVELEVQMHWIKEVLPGRHKVGFSFERPSLKTRFRLQRFIEKLALSSQFPQ